MNTLIKLATLFSLSASGLYFLNRYQNEVKQAKNNTDTTQKIPFDLTDEERALFEKYKNEIETRVGQRISWYDLVNYLKSNNILQ